MCNVKMIVVNDISNIRSILATIPTGTRDRDTIGTKTPNLERTLDPLL